MQKILQSIAQICINHYHQTPLNIIPLSPSGSSRKYFRVFFSTHSLIAVFNADIAENESFIYLNDLFHSLGLPVPKLSFMDKKKEIYFQEDLGDESLLERLTNKGFEEDNFTLLKNTLSELAKIQILANPLIDYQKLLHQRFDSNYILHDLLYFKFYFLDFLSIHYNKALLLNEFDKLSRSFKKSDTDYFMYRDFQGRNIMIKENMPYFIDFQGGMKGPLQYDLASILWQAKANIPSEWKTDLEDFYFGAVEKITQKKMDKARFFEAYNFYVLLRLVQVLGAYGLRGWIEKKVHFIESIPFAIQNLNSFLNTDKANFLKKYPVLNNILLQLSQKKIFLLPKKNNE